MLRSYFWRLAYRTLRTRPHGIGAYLRVLPVLAPHVVRMIHSAPSRRHAFPSTYHGPAGSKLTADAAYARFSLRRLTETRADFVNRWRQVLAHGGAQLGSRSSRGMVAFTRQPQP